MRHPPLLPMTRKRGSYQQATAVNRLKRENCMHLESIKPIGLHVAGWVTESIQPMTRLTGNKRPGVMSLPLRHAPLRLLALAVALLVLTLGIPWVAHAQTPPNESATGQPRVLASAEGAPYLFADTSRIADGNGIPFTPTTGEGGAIEFTYSYQWIRVDSGDSTQTNIGDGSARYRLVDADIGHLIKVAVSFTDLDSYLESLTSLPFGPVVRPAALASPATLVSNTGQSHSATGVIQKQYAQEFMLGDHGQGYEISSVSIELAAVPTDLTVSLWIGNFSKRSSVATTKLFDFENPATLTVGTNKFTAPPGVLAYHGVRYYIVLTNFGASLSIKETTSDDEDEGGETGAELADTARERALTETGRWGSASDRETGVDPNKETPVLRLAIEGARRASGILVSSYAQPFEGDQEIISLGDNCCFRMNVGAADRYLIHGFSWNSDNTDTNGGIANPWDLREGTSATGTKQVRLINTRNAAGITEWTAPQGATVAGGSGQTYTLGTDWDFPYHLSDGTRISAVLTRTWSTPPGNTALDTPRAAGVSLSRHGEVDVNQPIATVLGEPLYAMVQNLGQTDNGYVEVGDTNKQVLSQRFETGSNTDGYLLRGIGVNIEGSDDANSVAQVPDNEQSVSAAVYTAKTNGSPDTKLFDLTSPADFAPGHSFFEAPAGTRLDASTSYTLVWTYNGGTRHRLQQTTSDSEDSSRFTGFEIGVAFWLGADAANLTVDSGGNSLEIAVYTDAAPGVVVYTDTVPDLPGNATGLPVVLVSAEGGGAILAADTSRIADEDGLPHIGEPTSGIEGYSFSYRWFRVDGETETVVGTDSQRYQLVDDDIGKLIKVRVTFVDLGGFHETLTSLPFGPVSPRAPSRPTKTLVGNTGRTQSATANITTSRYAMGFKLGAHGQGYDISSVEIDLAAVPPSLSVSLWTAGAQGSPYAGSLIAKLFDFENPSSFRVGLNEFTAPTGAFLYQNLHYFIVLSGFGDSLSIKETASDAEDAGGEPGAVICNFSGNEYVVNEDQDDEMRVSCNDNPGDTGVLRLVIKGSKRTGGILASNYAQSFEGDQEIISVGDKIGFSIVVGAADRYHIRGVTFVADDSTPRGAGFINPFWLRSDSLSGDRHFDLANTRDVAGQGVWTAPQGATVEGGCTTDSMTMDVTCTRYVLDWGDFNVTKQNGVDRIGAVLSRFHQVADAADGKADAPTAPGVSLGTGQSVTNNDAAGPTPLMAVHGEALVAMVQNLGQTDDNPLTLNVGIPVTKVISQGFTTGSGAVRHRLQGVGVNIEGSVDTVTNVAQIPDDSASVLVSVYTDSNGKPGTKLFDLVSPTEFEAGHSFFEAPPGTYLQPSTSYVLVWEHIGGSIHELNLTASSSEDSGAAVGASIADGRRGGSSLTNLGSQTSHALQIAVYTEVVPVYVPLSWLHIPDGAEVGDQFRALFLTSRGRLPTSGEISDYNAWVQEEAGREYNHPIIRRAASRFKAVACTASVNARANTQIAGVFGGVPVHWLDGGWEDRPTLVANSDSDFYDGEWANTEYGAYVTGNSAHFEDHAMVLTGCDASGDAHPEFHMGNTSAMNMVAVGTPNGRSLKTREESVDPNFGPLGAVDVDSGYAYHRYYVTIDGQRQKRLLPLYAISPIFTVIDAPPERTIKESGQIRQPRAEVVMISLDSPLVPAGLGIADQFRLMFVSSTKRNAQSTDIADYNEFVQDLAAAGHADIQAHNSGFRAVACTGDVDAQDNTRTTGTGIRIYWLGGDKAADNYKDFYDGSWDESVNVRDESGTAITVPDNTQDYDPWTGCNDNGAELFIGSVSGALGTTNPGHGRLNNVVADGPLQTGGKSKASLNRLYGLSYIFQVR